MGNARTARTSQGRGRAAVIVTVISAFIAATIGLALPASAATITKTPTSVTVDSSPNASVGVAAVLLTAAVSPSAAGGTVAFTDNSAPIPGCEARRVNADSADAAHANCVTTFANPGAHTISVIYAGDSTHASSTGTVVLNVGSSPDFFQLIIGLFIDIVRNLNLFGLNAPAPWQPPLDSPVPATASTTPVYAKDFADPAVLLDGSTYYAFATQGGGAQIQRLTSTDRRSWTRTAQADALRALPAWADTLGTWAPDVQKVGTQYVMYYTVHARNGSECISLATAASPAQQFVDSSTAPLVCSGNGSIDPSLFVAPNGERFLLWGGMVNSAAAIVTRKLTADGLGFMPGEQVRLMDARGIGWAAANIESPSMVYVGGRYFLFYSGNFFTSPSYGIGYATCAGPAGPCTNASTSTAWLGSHGGAQGPGGQSFFTDTSGAVVMAYHAWGRNVGYLNRGVRALWTDVVDFSRGVPALA